MKKRLIYSFVLLLIVNMGAGCKPEKPEPPQIIPEDDGKSAVEMKFKAKFNGQDFDRAQVYITAAKDTIRIDALRYLLSNFYLLDSSFKKIDLADFYVYLNMATDPKYMVDMADFTIPRGNYKGFGFLMGLDSIINHGDPTQWPQTHPLNPSYTGLHWDWAGGYIFTVMEGYLSDNGYLNKAISFHVATLKNRVPFEFKRDIVIDGSKTFGFSIHLNEYFENPFLLSLKTDGHYSHSANIDPLMDKLVFNLSNIFTLDTVL